MTIHGSYWPLVQAKIVISRFSERPLYEGNKGREQQRVTPNILPSEHAPIGSHTCIHTCIHMNTTPNE